MLSGLIKAIGVGVRWLLAVLVIRPAIVVGVCFLMFAFGCLMDGRDPVDVMTSVYIKDIESREAVPHGFVEVLDLPPIEPGKPPQKLPTDLSGVPKKLVPMEEWQKALNAAIWGVYFFFVVIGSVFWYFIFGFNSRKESVC